MAGISVCRFVAGIPASAVSPVERLDLNDQDPFWLDTFDPGLPDLWRSEAGNHLRDGGGDISASGYGKRTLIITVKVVDTPDALATAQGLLHRELDRAENFIEYKRGQTSSIYWRTFRSVGRVSPPSYADTGWITFTAEVLAEPFAYGARVDRSAVVVNNDPAAGSNGCYADIAAVEGDVATPALIKADFSASIYHGLLIGTRRHGTPSNVTWFRQAETMTPLVDSGFPASGDAVMSGTGLNYMRTTFATPADAQRLRMADFLGAAGSDLRGTYRLFAVVRADSGSAFRIGFTLSPSATSPAVFNSTRVPVTVASSSLAYLVDMGLFALPLAADPVTEGYSGGVRSVSSGVLTIFASRTSGGGPLEWDYFVAVPADEELCLIDDSRYPLESTESYVLDGPRDASLAVTTATGVMAAKTLSRAGSFPLLPPNQTTRLIVLRPDKFGSADATYGNVNTRTVSLTVSYWPRFLWTRG
jgi:hypothetical protein